MSRNYKHSEYFWIKVMFKIFRNKILLFFVVTCLNFFSYGKDDITKELYRQHYKPFEASVFKKRTMINLGRSIPFGSNFVIEKNARAEGYDDFAIARIPDIYPLLDRSDDNLKNLLRSLESDVCIGYANVLLKRSREKPGDLNWIVRVTHDEGNRLEQEKIKKTGQKASQQEKDTFIAIGFFLRYLVKNKHVQ